MPEPVISYRNRQAAWTACGGHGVHTAVLAGCGGHESPRTAREWAVSRHISQTVAEVTHE